MPRDRNESLSADIPLSDLRDEGMIRVVTVRSPVCRGSISDIEVPRLPRGYRAIRAEDIPGENRLAILGFDIPILARDRVAYAGEPVLLLAGPDPAVLEDLRSTVRVSVQEEEPVLEWESFSPDQVLQRRSAVLGNPEKAFEAAAEVLEARYRTDSQEHLYPEPQGALAAFDYDKLVIRCATQWPFHVRDCVRSVLGVKPQEVIVRPTPLGIPMEGRLWYPSVLACHAALAAVLCRKPARILLSRDEDFRFTPKKSRSLVSLRAGLDPSGTLTVLEAVVVLNTGAYAPLASELLEQACLQITGSLSIPNLRVQGYAVRTNTPPLGAFSGMGAAHSLFAAESLANRIARDREEDPLEWRARHFLRKGSPLLSGERLRDRTTFEEIGSRLKASSDFARKHGSNELIRKRRSASRSEEAPRGIGIAFGYQANGASYAALASGTFTVETTLNKDLSLVISTSAIAGDDGIRSIWRSTAAGILGVPLGRVSISEVDTASVPDSGPSMLSRNISVVNRLIERSCVAIRSRRFRSPLPIASRAVHRPRNPLHWEEDAVRGYPFESLSCCGAVVELELDTWSMEPRILGVWLCVDGGRIASERFARGTLSSSTLAALGQCFRERLPFEDGRVAENGYREYGLLSLAEAPPIEIEFLPWSDTDPLKGIGELPFLCIPAAFASAAAQASDLGGESLPFDGAEYLAGMEAV